MEKRKIICIVGPTASGKTGWGVLIARKYNGEIISADSRQVYRKLDIGTGKDLEDYDDIPYHLINICQPGDKFTMFDWLERANAAIEDILSRGKTPIIVGGTGLYVQALIEGFKLTQKSKLPTGSAKARKSQNCSSKVKIYSRQELEAKTLKQLQKIFAKLEIENCKIDLENPHRLIRAIERAQSGEIVSKKKPDFEALQIAIDLPREVLYQRIDQGVDEWFEEGFVEEVQGLLDGSVDAKWLEKIGLEYRILTEYLSKNPKSEIRNSKQTESNSNKKNSKVWNLENSDLDIVSSFDIRASDFESFIDMKQKMKYAIHAYARRQLTWFRRFPEIVWCKDLKSAEKAIKKFLK